MKEDSLLLYAVTDRHWVKTTLYDQVKEALEAGVTFVQLREKNLDEDEFYNEALDIQLLCREFNVPFVLNDNVKLAYQINADGVHIGQDDMSLTEAREILGKDKIIGVSAHTVEEALEAEKNGADYLGVGAMFTTNSKDDAVDVSIETLKEIVKSVSIPVIAIGGITRENVKELKDTGIKGIAVISAIFAKEHLKEETLLLKREVEKIV